MDRVLEFSQYRLDVRRRLLTTGQRRVYVTSRALSILIALAERAGEVVTKRELHALIWPNEVVEEGTLRVHVAVLRKVLGERPREHQLIQNVHGRGYRLAVPVTELSAASPQAAESKSTDRISGYPLIGRDESIQQIAATLYENRLVTVTGPGGIGKTAAAQGVVDALAPGFAENVWIVDMAPVEAPAAVATWVASKLGVGVPTPDPLSSVLAYLRQKPTLLMLDNCEAVLDDVALFAQAVLSAAPSTRILATSREQLHVCGERVCRLAPLQVHSDADDTRGSLLSSPAIALFLQRAAMAQDGSLEEEELHQVARLCRRLEGNPLAIEIAAAWCDVLGLSGLLAAVDQGHHLSIVGPKSRTARYRSLRETLDASYNRLSDAERRIFRRSGVFLGSFDLEAATAVLPEVESGGDAKLNADEIFAALLSLASKSLLTCESDVDRIRYRLNETSRTYALMKLRECEELELTRHRCALWAKRVVPVDRDTRSLPRLVTTRAA